MKKKFRGSFISVLFVIVAATRLFTSIGIFIFEESKYKESVDYLNYSSEGYPEFAGDLFDEGSFIIEMKRALFPPPSYYINYSFTDYDDAKVNWDLAWARYKAKLIKKILIDFLLLALTVVSLKVLKMIASCNDKKSMKKKYIPISSVFAVIIIASSLFAAKNILPDIRNKTVSEMSRYLVSHNGIKAFLDNMYQKENNTVYLVNKKDNQNGEQEMYILNGDNYFKLPLNESEKIYVYNNNLTKKYRAGAEDERIFKQAVNKAAESYSHSIVESPEIKEMFFAIAIVLIVIFSDIIIMIMDYYPESLVKTDGNQTSKVEKRNIITEADNSDINKHNKKAIFRNRAGFLAVFGICMGLFALATKDSGVKDANLISESEFFLSRPEIDGLIIESNTIKNNGFISNGYVINKKVEYIYKGFAIDSSVIFDKDGRISQDNESIKYLSEEKKQKIEECRKTAVEYYEYKKRNETDYLNTDVVQAVMICVLAFSIAAVWCSCYMDKEKRKYKYIRKAIIFASLTGLIFTVSFLASYMVKNKPDKAIERMTPEEISSFLVTPKGVKYMEKADTYINLKLYKNTTGSGEVSYYGYLGDYDGERKIPFSSRKEIYLRTKDGERIMDNKYKTESFIKEICDIAGRINEIKPYQYRYGFFTGAFLSLIFVFDIYILRKRKKSAYSFS